MAKLLLTGDWHLRRTNPARRCDDFRATQVRKVEEVFDIAKRYEVDAVICPGDLFDTSGSDLETINFYLDLFRTKGWLLYATPGNHDVYGASLNTLGRSAFWTMVAGGVVIPLSHEPVVLGAMSIVGHTYMHGGPVPTPPKGSGFKILVTHEMIVENKIWREQEEFVYSYQYLSLNSNWDLILCGHYHGAFVSVMGDRVIVNPGALVRIKASKADMALRPGVVVFDTVDRKCEWVHLKAEPAEKVCAVDEKGEIPEPNPLVNEFIRAITPTEDGVPRFGSLSEIAAAEIKRANLSERGASLVVEYLAEAEREASK
jgi:DNA repair exonuclease SbcCD nuclease subunit